MLPRLLERNQVVRREVGEEPEHGRGEHDDEHAVRGLDGQQQEQADDCQADDRLGDDVGGDEEFAWHAIGGGGT